MKKAKRKSAESKAPVDRSRTGKNRARMLRFLVLFPLCLLAGFWVAQAQFAQPALNAGTAGLVCASATIIRVFGGHAIAEGNQLQNPVSGFALSVLAGCNGINVMILFWGAVLAFPARWAQKIKGLAWGACAIHGLNLIRIISLFYLGQYNLGWFDFAHLYLWESLMMLDTLAVFSLWVHLSHRRSVLYEAI